MSVNNDQKPASTETWPELAMGLYDKLTGRGAEISYEFKDWDVQVPSKAGDGATHASWKVNGVLSIRTRDTTKIGN